MVSRSYIMEHEEEAQRLDLKTDRASVNRQALWAGIRPGMRVADIGCGSGKTTHYLHQLVQPGGEAVGIDASAARIEHAEQQYREEGVRFVCKDFYQPLLELGRFDFIWVRFVLEYHCSHSREIVGNLVEILKPGGILCLIDLDHNCLNHFGLSPRLDRAIHGIMGRLEKMQDFDPYTGRKLYSYLYDMGLKEIAVEMSAHHLIYGPLNKVDAYNWTMKVEVAAKNSGYAFDEYPGGFEEFQEEFRAFFADPRRFTYTPLIACRGIKSNSG
ncbi:class I SAM-dependent methyltransferase [Geobacter chapellei]|uniref:Class I SAM-dependent methyltransferase n=2 Tax=Pelotalea chapellei TaxID=44671 RepID=A0ABS5UC23_9BACT|nr:class I SAM-dependent methyltransferase [Pelotalea chapellei]